MITHADRIAVVNAGSSSLKVSLFEEETLDLKFDIERLGRSDGAARAHIRTESGDVLFDDSIEADSVEAALEWVFAWLDESRPEVGVSAFGHRVVHGGNRFTELVLIEEPVLTTLESLTPLAPLHMPHNLAPMRSIDSRWPGTPQVACFDTAFHAGQDRLERTYALPLEFAERGVVKYGFHGLSYEYIASVLPSIDERAATGLTVVCHLGNGSSLCALRAGRSTATSMGFTPLEGVPMGTRCGSIDPGVLLYLLEQEAMRITELSDLLYKRSGLLGLSGISSDMRDLLASDEPSSKFAVEHFCYRIAGEIARLASVLEGLDAVVFTGGIGEHSDIIRAKVAERCRWLGVEVDAEANIAGASAIHADGSSAQVLVIPTNEELMIARHVRTTLG